MVSATTAICELCGRTFATEQEKEQHKQSEHKQYVELSRID